MHINKLIKIAVIGISFFISSQIHAQPDSLWSRTFGGRSYDLCFSIIQADDGGYALAGYTSSFGDGSFNFWLVKTDEDCDSIWSQTYGGDPGGFCKSGIQTADGGYALAGQTYSIRAYEIDMLLVKTDADGDTLWTRTFGRGEKETCRSIIQTTDGGYALAGITDSGGDGGSDIWLVKTDADGDSIWSQTYGGDEGDWCRSLVQTDDGDYLLAGYTGSFGDRSYDMWLLKIDADGDSLWSRTIGGRGRDRCYSIIQTDDGGYALAGFTDSFGAGQEDMWLVKVDEEGDSLWSATFGGEEEDRCESIVQTDDGGYVLGGWTYSFGADEGDMLLVKMDDEGNLLWSQTFGGEAEDRCYSIIQTVDGGYYLAGWTESFGAGESDMWLVKTGPDPVSVPSESFTSHPSAFILSPAYPNPFNSSTTITYQLPHPSNVSLTVYNPNGRRVGTLVDEQLAGGIYNTTWQPESLASGLYFVRFEAGDRMQMRKLVMIR